MDGTNPTTVPEPRSNLLPGLLAIVEEHAGGTALNGGSWTRAGQPRDRTPEPGSCLAGRRYPPRRSGPWR